MCLHTYENIFLMLRLPANTVFHSNVLSALIGQYKPFKVPLVKSIKGGEHKYDELLPVPTPHYQGLKESSSFKTGTKCHRIGCYLVIMWSRKMYSYSFFFYS